MSKLVILSNLTFFLFFFSFIKSEGLGTINEVENDYNASSTTVYPVCLSREYVEKIEN